MHRIFPLTHVLCHSVKQTILKLKLKFFATKSKYNIVLDTVFENVACNMVAIFVDNNVSKASQYVTCHNYTTPFWVNINHIMVSDFYRANFNTGVL